jgi:hypothetical protein
MQKTNVKKRKRKYIEMNKGRNQEPGVGQGMLGIKWRKQVSVERN